MTKLRCPDCGRLTLLDAFSGAGGCAAGYHRAGFCVTGVDHAPQPRYPFRFTQGDAVEFIAEHGHRFAAVHASPPCKRNTSLKAFSGAHHLELIPETREALLIAGRPYVIENVPGAEALMRSPITLCGSTFDLGVRRHRLFETSFPLDEPAHDHAGQAARSPGYPVKRYHSGRPVVTVSPVVGVFGRGQGLGPGEVKLWQQAMGIDWMSRDEMREAIPPAYTEHVGRALLDHIATTRQESAA